MIQDDFYFIDNNIQTENYSIHDEPLIDTVRKVFTPCFQKLDSFYSQKSNNDMYFRKESSIFPQNSYQVYELEKKNSCNNIDNFDNAYKQIGMNKNSDQHDFPFNKGDEDLISEDGESSPLFFSPYMNMAGPGCFLSVYDIDTVNIHNNGNTFKEVKGIGTECYIPVTETEKPKKKKSKRGKRGPYKKKPKPIIKTVTDDKCFPFTAKKGTNNSLFRTNVYLTTEEGSKKKEKKARKFKPDDIRKKIKVRFHKKIKNIINENLKKAGSNELISFLPQFFIGNIAKKFNKQYFNTTFEDLLKIDFSTFQEEYFNKECDKKQFYKNMKTLEYLEKNQEISKISGFDIVKKMKYRDILKAYFSSHEFEISVKQLEEEKESEEYIQEYIYLAKNYIEYFTKGDECV